MTVLGSWSRAASTNKTTPRNSSFGRFKEDLQSMLNIGKSKLLDYRPRFLTLVQVWTQRRCSTYQHNESTEFLPAGNFRAEPQTNHYYLESVDEMENSSRHHDDIEGLKRQINDFVGVDEGKIKRTKSRLTRADCRQCGLLCVD